MTYRSPLLVLACALACADSSDDTGGDSGGGDDSESSSTSSDIGVVTDTSESSGPGVVEDSSSSDDSADSGSASSSSTTGVEEQPFTTGLVQYDGDAHFGDWDFNTASLTEWAEAAIAEGATMVVFPEGSSYGYASPTEVWCAPDLDEYAGRSCRSIADVAEPLPGGPTTDYWAAFAAEHDVIVVYHVPEVDGDAYYNAIGVVDPDGFVTGYRKRTLYYVDAAYATPGDSPVVIDTPGGRFGLMICLDGTYDGGFYDEYAAMDVDGIVIPMDWDDDPNGPAAAIDWFRDRAAMNDVRIWAADVSTWDGTAFYPPGDVPRERNGLPEIAIGIDGISVHALP
jgi:N-carbamoylputrescine amidase